MIHYFVYVYDPHIPPNLVLGHKPPYCVLHLFVYTLSSSIRHGQEWSEESISVILLNTRILLCEHTHGTTTVVFVDPMEFMNASIVDIVEPVVGCLQLFCICYMFRHLVIDVSVQNTCRFVCSLDLTLIRYFTVSLEVFCFCTCLSLLVCEVWLLLQLWLLSHCLFFMFHYLHNTQHFVFLSKRCDNFERACRSDS